MINHLLKWQQHLQLRRAVFVLFNLLAVVLALFLFVIPMYSSLSERDAAISEQAAVLARLKSIANQRSLVQSLSQQADASFGQGEFLSGASEGVINADLQTRVKALTEAASGRLNSIQIIPTKQIDTLKYVGVRIDFAGTLQTVQRTIHAIETSKPYLFITAASMKMPRTSGPQPLTQEPMMQVQFDVLGALQPAKQDGQ